MTYEAVTPGKDPIPSGVGSFGPPSKRPRGREVAPPSGSKGNPEGKEWTTASWRACRIDFFRLEAGARSVVGKATAKVRPADRALKTTRMGATRSDPETQEWPADACAYCFHRPKAPPGSPESDVTHPNNWWYGTGIGNHNPYLCQPSKRYLAEGGDKNGDNPDPPGSADFLARCLRFAPGSSQQ